ncbi:Glu/Leu/Phe/Val family dehydrogenase [Candidatus Paracaedibacter symbiosus]|uniref:Glu/Leu/Phe/Val family dehydrogenase n=1 Tax=Candidatus Paracaedibacter symbiosus TaxID=244582 RepID=UPI0005096A26|nr:Glu/Leu/Phe/Val dehydrogenase [Candidatus Paracaedibacter symbiosus]
MATFSATDFDNHEQVVFCNDAKTGLKAIIAIHNTHRGPALGGCRFWAYPNEDEALKDVLRLSRGMTYKAAMAQLNLGGGKSVIIGDAKKDKTPEMMIAFGKYIEHLNGLYITAEDVGTTTQDMGFIRQSTHHVVGLADTPGGSGDPSIFTGYGVYLGIKASVKHKFGEDSVKGLRIAVQGLGHVGMNLVERLSAEGAELVVTDINQDSVAYASSKFNAKAASPDSILATDCDLLAPCALGGGLHDQTIEKLRCKIVAGAANNQLAHPDHGEALRQLGILYAPDYVINAGGLINVTYEGPSYSRDKVINHVDKIYTTMLEIFETANKQNLATNIACDQIAEQRFHLNKQ